VTDWFHKIQILRSQFREAALLNCNDGAREGILDLADRLHNFCFYKDLRLIESKQKYEATTIKISMR